jgi:DmsE family decaheme c-type cytochrome
MWAHYLKPVLANYSLVRLLFGAVARSLSGWRLCLLAIFCASLLQAFSIAQRPAAATSCSNCHAALMNSFQTTRHGKVSTAHPAGISCESCHGDGKSHADSNGDPSRVQNPAKLNVRDADALCLGCHSASHPYFGQSAHANANVGCANCHSVHSAKAENLLKAPQPTLCFQCHTGIESEFSAPVHHKVDDGPVKCSVCHDPHAIFQRQLQAAIAQDVSACLKCHTELAGPYIYQHKAVMQAGCSACHTPHGGKTPKLLTLANVNAICLQCHLPPATLDDAETNAAHAPSSSKPCTDCHVAIHGSSHDNRFMAP